MFGKTELLPYNARSHSRCKAKDTRIDGKGKTSSIESEQTTASKCLFQKRRTLPRGPKQQKHVEGTLTCTAALRRIRRAYIFRNCDDFDHHQKKRERKTGKSHTHVVARMRFVKTLILQVYRPALFPNDDDSLGIRQEIVLFSPAIFSYGYFFFISLRSAPDRGTNRNASKRVDRREKLCGVYGLARGR